MSLTNAVSSKRCFLNRVKDVAAVTSIINRGKIGNLNSSRNKFTQALVGSANFVEVNVYRD